MGEQKQKTSQHPIHSLISMLDEPDSVLFEKISASIINFGSGALTILDNALDDSFDPLISSRLRDLIDHIHTDTIVHDLKRWKSSLNQDVFQLMIILASYYNRNLNAADLNEKINGLQKQIWLELNENLTSLECVRLVNHFIFQTWKFRRNDDNLLNTDLLFVNSFLEGKTGSSSMLGAFYLGMCQRLSLPVFFIELPDNFILAYTRQALFSSKFKPGQVFFYINPLLDGVIFNKSEIERFLKTSNIPSKPHYFEPCTNLRVASLLLRELRNYFVGSMDDHRVNQVQRMLAVVEDEIQEMF
jgi:regulator of sirC expression with transglutaminase-like and TPR domain